MVRELGAVPVVFAVDDPHHREDRWRFDGCETHVLRGRGPRQLAFAPGLARALDRARLDLLHLHGIWQYPSHAAGAWARRHGKPLVISPHGMLDPWIAQSRSWKKRIARVVWERRAWRNASAFHALTVAEQQDIVEETGSTRIAVIPNAAPPLSTQPSGPRPPHALYLGRIHRKKNIAALIEAWTRALPDLPEGSMLTIAGWGDDAGIAALEADMLGADPSIEFVGTAFGSQKLALLELSRFCVLPSFSEGLPMVILEAWAAGTPTIMTEACQLPEGYTFGAALPCGTDVESLRRALVAGFALNAEGWLTMAHAAQGLASGPFGPEWIRENWEGYLEALLLAAD